MNVYSLISFIQHKLDCVTMYRTVLIALAALTIYSIVIVALGYADPLHPITLTLSALTAISIAGMVNILMGILLKTPVNHESAIITALIIFFLIDPPALERLTDLYIIAAVTTLAIVSKFIIAYRKQHITNPAAVGAVLMSFIFLLPSLSYFETTWWIGRVEFFIPLLIAGGLVVMKLRKWTPVLAFLLVSFTLFTLEGFRFGGTFEESVSLFWLSGPSLFLAFFMLTEPFTMPPTKKLQFFYGAFVGVVAQLGHYIPYLPITPEFALVAGNIAFYGSTLRQKLIMPLMSVSEVAHNTFEFIFKKPRGLHFKAGQYLEWMLPHEKPDNRGIRRYFTIASAPSEEHVSLAVRFSENGSSYKKLLKDLKPGDTIIASQLAGDFTLPTDTKRRIGAIAGGIGITPFVSHVKELQAQSDKRDYALFYCNNTAADIAYKTFFDDAAASNTIALTHVLAKEVVPGYENGYLTAAMIQKHTPDYVSRDWYISGPPALVDACHRTLCSMGVPRSQIKQDFFPGLA